jgi:hypothetical protein
MGTLQIGHGSEFHLLRFLGRHRQRFDEYLAEQLTADRVVGWTRIEWLDFPFNPKSPTKDGEWKSMDFLPDHGGTRWREFWPDKKVGQPHRDGVPSWDAVGLLHFPDRQEWLLVAAKAHEAELGSPRAGCGAGGKSLACIKQALQKTYKSLVPERSGEWPALERAWLGRYYQMANRLACLSFLNENGERSRLLYVCFVGDTDKKCPANGARWKTLSDEANGAMGLEKGHGLRDRIHYIHPNVNGAD